MVAILDKFLNRISPAYHQRSLTAHFRPPTGVPGSQTGPRVLFIPFYTDPLFLARETFFAKALEWRGARTALLYADCHISPTERGELPAKLGFRHPVLAGGARLLDHLHQEGLPVSKFYRPTDRNSRQRELRELTPEDLESYHYRDIHLGDLAVSSSVRILMSMGPEWDNPTYRSLVLDLLCTGIELVDTFYRAYDDYRPDRIVMSHAIYLTWGVAFRVARQLDILTLVYNGSYRRDTLRMYVNVPNAPFPEAEWPRFRDVALTDVERRWAEKYLASRAHLEGEAHDLFGGEDFPADLSSFIQQSKADGKRLATLFTNMSWDAYAFSGTGAFASMVDWANATLEFARSNPELRLIFKIHPAEAYWGVPEAYRIRNHLVDIPANVFLLTEHDKVKPFQLYRHMDFGLINISTVAVEMAYLGLPVLTSGAKGHYEGRGFTLSPGSREEYFDYLRQLTEGKGDFVPDREMLLRYVFYRFYREAVPFEPLSLKGYGIDAVNIDDYADLQPGRLPGMDIFADAVLNGTTAVWTDPPSEIEG